MNIDFNAEVKCKNCESPGKMFEMIIVGKDPYCETCFDAYKESLRKKQPELEKKTSMDYVDKPTENLLNEEPKTQPKPIQSSSFKAIKNTSDVNQDEIDISKFF
jgi:hypothetical protein